MKKFADAFTADTANCGTGDLSYYKAEVIRLLKLAVQEIPLDQIDESTNVRKEYNEQNIIELAESIKEHDLLNPVQVTQTGSRFQLISGYRRFRAHKYLKKETIKAIIIDPAKKNLKAIQLIENIQREELSPHDLELAVKELHDEGLSYDDIARILKKSKSWISTIISAKQIREDNQAILEEAGIGQTVGSSVLGSLSGLEKEEIAEVLSSRIKNNQPVTCAAVKEEKQRLKEKKGEKPQPDMFNIKIISIDDEYTVQIKETGRVKEEIKEALLNCLHNIKELEPQFQKEKSLKASCEDIGVQTC